MPDLDRFEPKCYYASDRYTESFWGKYVWLYEGQGSLRLTDEGLELQNGPCLLSIPFDQIKGVSLGRFSWAMKPAGLSRLTVHSHKDGALKTIHLIPYHSTFDPTWTTSAIVEDWYRSLVLVEELTGRVESASPSLSLLARSRGFPGFNAVILLSWLAAASLTAGLVWMLLSYQ
jgi:hypothetical protein